MPALARGFQDVPLPPAGSVDTIAVSCGALPCLCGARLPLGVRLGLRSRNRPVFEGRWCCGAECTLARMEATVRREAGSGRGSRRHTHRMPLGLVLLSNGAVSREELTRALQVQAETGERIGDVLLRECAVTERQVAEALAVQWGCGVWDVAGAKEQMAAVAPRVVLERCSMLPVLCAKTGRLAVTFAQGVDAQGVYALRRIHDVQVDAGLAAASDWAEAHARMRMAAPVAEEFVCRDEAVMAREAARMLQRAQPVESRGVRVHEMLWLRMWLEPAALAGGVMQAEDVVDCIFRLG